MTATEQTYLTDDNHDDEAVAVRADRQDSLFYAPGATEGTTQWRAETLQVVNWGGFQGRVRFPFHPGSTLISGHSGTGKSTMLDAYIALMMPSETAFNGASNDAGGGRARGDEQRSLTSYLRGKVDDVTDDQGRSVDRLLRGINTATWGAVAMTFINDHSHRFTALRAFHVPARATRDGDIKKRLATCEGTLDLADLEEFAADAFAPAKLKARFTGLRTHDSYGSFANTVHTRLGIGANGDDGAKALKLLVRIQSGQRIRTVDELYKDMVLERPTTFDKADQAIEHFDNLEAAYLAMANEQKKAELLAPIIGHQARLEAARADIAALDTVGLTRQGDTPLRLWQLRTKLRLIDAAAVVNKQARIGNADSIRDAIGARRNLETDLAATREQHRAAGGEELDTIAAHIRDAGIERDERTTKRADLSARITILATPLADKASYDQLIADADTFLTTYDDQVAALDAEGSRISQQRWPLMDRKASIDRELTSMRGRTGRVPEALDELRRHVAAASGIDVNDLPFVAELIDVAPEHTRWRTAIETVLGASARTLLVPDEHLDHFSAAIDDLHLKGRITFRGATRVDHTPVHASPTHIAGKLLYKDSPYSAWVAAFIADPSRNARCVASASELSGREFSVTEAGQTRRGRSGSHGRGETRNIIGFSNTDTIAELTAELEEVDVELRHLDDLDASRTAKARDLHARNVAYNLLINTSFADIDVAEAEQRIATFERRRDDIKGADDQLRVLEEQLTGLEAALDAARKRLYILEEAKSALDTTHATLATDEDETNNELWEIEDAQHVTLTDEQALRLDQEFRTAASPSDPDVYADFTANLLRLQRRLEATVARASEEAERAATDLVNIFNAYQNQWEDPNLGKEASDYPDYARILDDITATGLHERRNEWRRRLTSWSGDDLVPLLGAMETAIEDIEDRLVPINDILRGLDFGANADRLRIKLRRLTREEVTVFMRDLRRLSRIATAELNDDQVEARFQELRAFINKMRKKDDPRAEPTLTDRENLLDRRKHVEVTAESYTRDEAGREQHRSTYNVLGWKSGGETQELVAFIVGAALRFRLGDEERSRPRFAPVFLDEAFVKADAQFAGRAVEAWKGLGFQLIVGAPVDKVTGLEPHMDELLGITKNETTGYSFVSRITDVTPSLSLGDVPAGRHRAAPVRDGDTET